MDGDFQQHYQAAEQAYGEGNYLEAKRIAAGLLAQLSDSSQDPDIQAAMLGWRAFVALLLGHIELYGLENAGDASGYYRLVLDSQPHETLAELAQQGLQQATAAVQTPPAPEATAIATAAPASTLPALLRDPFLTDQPQTPGQQPAAVDQPTAMPWLEQMAEPTPTPEPTPQPTPTPTPTPEPSPEPTPEPTPQPTPEPTVTPAPTETPRPTPEPTPDPREILAGSLLRVSVTLPAEPDQKTGEPPTESPGSSWIQRLLRRR